jgi:hypothetical protein
VVDGKCQTEAIIANVTRTPSTPIRLLVTTPVMPSSNKISYQLVDGSDSHTDLDADETSEINSKGGSAITWSSRVSVALLILLSLMLGGLGVAVICNHQLQTFTTSSVAICKDPVTRHEWRSLGSDEKREYIAAVQCLKETPSRLGLNQSLYDDFPYIHSTVGNGSVYNLLLKEKLLTS